MFNDTPAQKYIICLSHMTKLIATKKNTNVYDVVISALTSKFHYLKKCKLGWVDTEFLSLYLN